MQYTHANTEITAATELASRNTGMSFQRTRLSADRTLMSVIRTSLALITFGFTIFQFFQKLKIGSMLQGNINPARNFGIALLSLGIIMLILGIIYHIQFMLGLRTLRKQMIQQHLIHGESHFPVSLTLITAIILLMIAVVAGIDMIFQIGPF